jgi:1-acyl-sn-glycerol-3-phosphate acyltransferase
VSVVPFALKGTREVLPIGSIHVKGGPVELLLGDPIPMTGPSESYTLKDREQVTARMRASVADLLAQLERE